MRALTGVGWGLGLTALVLLAGPGAKPARPEPPVSSAPERPPLSLPALRLQYVAAMPHLVATPTPTPTPTPTSTPSPTATPTPTSTSTATPTLAPSPTPALAPPSFILRPTPTPPPPRISSEGRAIVDLTNELRAQHRLPPLAVSGALALAAQEYADVLAEHDWFSHQGPDGSTLASRAEAAGYTGWVYLAENLYGGPDGGSMRSVVEAWSDSPGHLSLLLSASATEIGAGCSVRGDYRWCVQNMGAR